MMKKKNNILRILLLAFILITNLFVLCTRAKAAPVDSISLYPPISFQEYLNLVGKNNLSYIAEKYNIQIADAEVIGQKVLPDPELSFEAADESLLVELNYSLELGNKRGARVRLAKSQADFERLAVEHFFQELRAEATDAYLEAIMQKELLDVRNSSQQYMHQLSQSDSIRFSLGEIDENEARQSKIESVSLLNDVYKQEAEYKSSLVSINEFMGKTFEDINHPVGNWAAFNKSYLLTELISQALSKRVDMIAAVKNTEVATNQLRLTKAERKMDIGILAGYERDWSRRIYPTRFSMLKAGLSIPLQFSNTNKGAIRSTEYSIQQSRTESQNVELQVQKEVAQAYYAYEATQKQVRQFQTGLLSDAQKLLDGVVYKYQRGETNILDVLIAQRTYNEIQEQYLETLKENASALVELQKVCGIWDIEF